MVPRSNGEEHDSGELSGREEAQESRRQQAQERSLKALSDARYHYLEALGFCHRLTKDDLPQYLRERYFEKLAEETQAASWKFAEAAQAYGESLGNSDTERPPPGEAPGAESLGDSAEEAETQTALPFPQTVTA